MTKIQTQKVKHLIEKWHDSGYHVDDVESYNEGRTTIAVVGYVERTWALRPSKSPVELATEQNLYVFLEDRSGILGRVYFYDKTRLNRLAKDCLEMAQYLESTPEYLQECEDMKRCREIHSLIHTFLINARLSVNQTNYYGAHISLCNVLREIKRLEYNPYRYAEKADLAWEIKEGAEKLKKAFAVLLIDDKGRNK